MNFQLQNFQIWRWQITSRLVLRETVNFVSLESQSLPLLRFSGIKINCFPRDQRSIAYRAQCNVGTCFQPRRFIQSHGKAPWGRGCLASKPEAHINPRKNRLVQDGTRKVRGQPGSGLYASHKTHTFLPIYIFWKQSCIGCVQTSPSLRKKNREMVVREGGRLYSG